MSVYVGDYGFQLEIVITTDDTANIQSAVIEVRKPSGAEVQWNAGFDVIDASTVRLHHTVQQGELDEAGLWKVQAVITYADGRQHAETRHFVVKNEFE
ncbi:hypothetical protein [Geoglobus ahangari]